MNFQLVIVNREAGNSNVISFVFRSIKGLAGFEHVKEVVLDNNQISDDVELPQLDNVETLTLNKNNVSFYR